MAEVNTTAPESGDLGLQGPSDASETRHTVPGDVDPVTTSQPQPATVPLPQSPTTRRSPSPSASTRSLSIRDARELNGRIDQVEDDIGDLGIRMLMVENHVDRLDRNIVKLEGSITEKFNDMTEKFDDMTGKFNLILAAITRRNKRSSDWETLRADPPMATQVRLPSPVTCMLEKPAEAPPTRSLGRIHHSSSTVECERTEPPSASLCGSPDDCPAPVAAEYRRSVVPTVQTTGLVPFTDKIGSASAAAECQLISDSATPGFDNPVATSPSNLQEAGSEAPLRPSAGQEECFPGAFECQVTRMRGATLDRGPGGSSISTPSTEGKPTLSKERVPIYRSLHSERSIPPTDTPPPGKSLCIPGAIVCQVTKMRGASLHRGLFLVAFPSGRLALSGERASLYCSLHSEQAVPPTDKPPPAEIRV
jgi:hypothetical protein